MDGLRDRIDDVANLITEFGLAEAELSGPDWRVRMAKRKVPVPAASATTPTVETADEPHLAENVPLAMPEPPKVSGIPINSPMTGIYYTAPSPSAPAFVKVGDVVEAGQVVGLIEAMKVFNEIVAPMSGTVTEITAQNGQLVQPGEPLIYLG